mmetsp:Transcript_22006/g.53757  ORF Transcript_22006/g.53757 Transcript_22006/m.53757 type:complete len:266 (+) Transcript_22006:146-943(+)
MAGVVGPTAAVSSKGDGVVEGTGKLRKREAHFRRGLFYFAALVGFAVVLEAQLRYQTPRPDRPMKVFGGRFVFLTVQVNFIIAAYVLACLVESVIGRRVRGLGRATGRASAVVFPLGVFMGAGYYVLVHFHPKTRMVARAVQDFDYHMHLLHGFPLLFVVADTAFDALGERGLEYDLLPALKARVDAAVGSLYAVSYACWTFVCSHFNDGWWPYPFLQSMPLRQKLILYSLFVATIPVLTACGTRLRGSATLTGRVRPRPYPRAN